MKAAKKKPQASSERRRRFAHFLTYFSLLLFFYANIERLLRIRSPLYQINFLSSGRVPAMAALSF